MPDHPCSLRWQADSGTILRAYLVEVDWVHDQTLDNYSSIRQLGWDVRSYHTTVGPTLRCMLSKFKNNVTLSRG